MCKRFPRRLLCGWQWESFWCLDLCRNKQSSYRFSLQMVIFLNEVLPKRQVILLVLLCFNHCPFVSLSPSQNILLGCSIWNLADPFMLLKREEASVFLRPSGCVFANMVPFSADFSELSHPFKLMQCHLVFYYGESHPWSWAECVVNKCQKKWNNYFMSCTYENTI